MQDRDGAKLLLGKLDGVGKKLRCIWVDGGYSGKLLTWVQQRFRFGLQPVLRPFGGNTFVPLPKRWVVERTFAWLSSHRRLSKDYEALMPTSETFLYIAMIRIMLRRLTR